MPDRKQHSLDSGKAAKLTLLNLGDLLLGNSYLLRQLPLGQAVF